MNVGITVEVHGVGNIQLGAFFGRSRAVQGRRLGKDGDGGIEGVRHPFLAINVYVKNGALFCNNESLVSCNDGFFTIKRHVPITSDVDAVGTSFRAWIVDRVSLLLGSWLGVSDFGGDVRATVNDHVANFARQTKGIQPTCHINRQILIDFDMTWIIDWRIGLKIPVGISI